MGTLIFIVYSFDKQNPLAAEAKLERQLTQGDFEMLGVEAVDEAAGTVFFSANKDDPRQRHLFSVKLDGSSFQALTHEEGMHFGEFADDGKHYADTYSASLAPPKLTLCAVAGSCYPVWEARSVADYGLTPEKFLEFKADDGTTLYGRLLLPPNQPTGKIPLIVNIYGGPAAQLVLKGGEDRARSSIRFLPAKASPSSPLTTAERPDVTANSRPRFATSLGRSNSKTSSTVSINCWPSIRSSTASGLRSGDGRTGDP